MERMDVATKAHTEFRDITDQIRTLVSRSKISSGVVHLFIPHTTAGVTINENADPDVTADMIEALELAVPWKQNFYKHSEGNSAAHIKASMMGFATTLMVENGAMVLGMWQGIYLCEFDGPRTRQVWVRIEGRK